MEDVEEKEVGFLKLIKQGWFTSYTLVQALRLHPVSDVRRVMETGFPILREKYEKWSDQGYLGDWKGRIKRLNRALEALGAGEEFAYEGIRVPAVEET